MKKPERPSRRITNDLGKSEIVATPTGLAVVEELASRGCSVVTISAALGVNKETFVHMRRRDPAVDDAFERGRAKEHDRLVRNLNTAAEGGNVIASIFLLKARHSYREGEPLEVNVNVNTGGVLVVPARQTVEEYIEAKRAAGEIDPEPPMRDVTPARRREPPEPIEYLPAAPIPTSGHDAAAPATTDTTDHKTGTRLLRLSGRGD